MDTVWGWNGGEEYCACCFDVWCVDLLQYKLLDSYKLKHSFLTMKLVVAAKQALLSKVYLTTPPPSSSVWELPDIF